MVHYFLIRAEARSEYDSESLMALFTVDLDHYTKLVDAAKRLHDDVGAARYHLYEPVEWCDFTNCTEEEEETLLNCQPLLITKERAEELEGKMPVHVQGDTLVVEHDGDLWFEGYVKHADIPVESSMFNISQLRELVGANHG